MQFFQSYDSTEALVSTLCSRMTLIRSAFESASPSGCFIGEALQPEDFKTKNALFWLLTRRESRFTLRQVVS